MESQGHVSLRYQPGILSFFYFNAASFSNICPRPWELFTLRSFHYLGTSFEAAVSAHWQDLCLRFVKDPVHGLPRME
ncbi:chlorogenic acid esterase precursor [Penicillium frequentans]|nr:chlorogenic acid esterase precursor [Penicillium glabrum]